MFHSFFLVLFQDPSIHFFFLSFLPCGPLEWPNPLDDKFFIIIRIIYSFEFFTSALADSLSPKFEWQQVSSSL